MRRTRPAYHYAIRLIKKERDYIVKHRFATAMLGNKSRDFWAEVRKMTGKYAGTSTTVDGVSEPDKIAELFASKYQTLYSSVAYSTSDMDRIKHCIHTRIANISTGENSSFCISAEEIGMCISMLKLHKNDGGTRLNTNHFNYANTDLHFHVAFFIFYCVSRQCS